MNLVGLYKKEEIINFFHVGLIVTSQVAGCGPKTCVTIGPSQNLHGQKAGV